MEENFLCYLFLAIFLLVHLVDRYGIAYLYDFILKEFH